MNDLGWQHRSLQTIVANPLRKMGLPIWYDVATFSLRGHVCRGCGRISHTERTHLGHDCYPLDPEQKP